MDKKYYSVKVLQDCKVNLINLFDNDQKTVNYKSNEVLEEVRIDKINENYFINFSDGWGGQILIHFFEKIS
jgi:UDP-glucose 6-dehydrogenase